MIRFQTFYYFLLLIFFNGCSEPNRNIVDADLVIVQINDVYEIDGVNQGKEGGLARIQGLVDSLKRVHEQVLLVHAGDFLNPSLIGNLKDSAGRKIKGQHMVEVMNSMSFDAVAFGNHEIDLSYTELQRRLNEMQFDMLTANLFYKDSSMVKPFSKHDQAIKPFKDFIVKTENGAKTLSLTSVILPYNKKNYVLYKDVDSTVNGLLMNELKDKDGVFLLSHLNRETDAELGEKYQSINLIMGGHDHYHFCDTVGSQRYVTKADANARTAWVHYITWNDASQEFLSNSLLVNVDGSIRKNTKVEDVVQKWRTFAKQQTAMQGYNLERVVADLDRPLNATEESIRSEQTNFGKLVCESMAAQFDTTDIVVLNSGSVRYDDLILSPVTEGDILKALPFGGGIKGAYVSGEFISQVLAASNDNRGTGAYLQVYQIPKDFSEYGVYFLVTTDYVAAGREKNLEFMKDLNWKTPKPKDSSEIDIRKIVINYLLQNRTNL